jgi:2,5-diketo-D-gluconate reductase B
MIQLPNIGLGTFRLQGQHAHDAVANGLAAGYRHVDTAQIYGNEAEVGQALAGSGVPREQVFVTTKVWTEHLRAEALDQLDLALIHWPSPGDEVSLAESMQALLHARELGLARAIGVSNFTIAHMRAAIDAVGAENIATNQVELHPFLQNRAVAAFAREAGIRITAYMPLAYGKAVAHPAIQAVAARLAATPAQVTLAWLLARGHAVIPSSTRREHLDQNLGAARLALTSADIAAIDALDAGERIANPDFAPRWD